MTHGESVINNYSQKRYEYLVFYELYYDLNMEIEKEQKNMKIR